MKIVVVADAHLRGWDRNSAQFLNFLEKLPEEKPDLVILQGDIFDFYCDQKQGLTQVIDATVNTLTRLSKYTKVIFVEGNHEFGIDIPGVIIRRNFFSLRLNNKKILFTHGDEIASWKIWSPFIRNFLHSPILSKIVCPLFPPKLLWYIAVKLSSSSRKKAKIDSDEINRRLAKFFKISEDYDMIITAHSHKYYFLKEGRRSFVAIGPWYEEFQFCIIEGENIRLKRWVKT